MKIVIYILTKIDTVDPKTFETGGASLLAILSGAVDFKGLAAICDKSKLRGKKDLVTFASTLEPSTDKLFTVAVQAVKG